MNGRFCILNLNPQLIFFYIYNFYIFAPSFCCPCSCCPCCPCSTFSFFCSSSYFHCRIAVELRLLSSVLATITMPNGAHPFPSLTSLIQRQPDSVSEEATIALCKKEEEKKKKVVKIIMLAKKKNTLRKKQYRVTTVTKKKKNQFPTHLETLDVESSVQHHHQ